MAVDYSVFINRILEVLQAEPKLKEKISEFRFGDAGDNKDKEINANSYPLCYITTATNPEVSRVAITSAKSVNSLPSESRELEFWIIIATTGATPADTQKSLYELVNLTCDTLEKNIQLREPLDDDDPLCSTSKIFTQRRLEKMRGTLVESLTIRLRPRIIVAY